MTGRPSPASPLVAWVGLGSNLGDRAATLAKAAGDLSLLLEGFVSTPPVESAAVDRTGRPAPEIPPYLNAVGRGSYLGTPRSLLRALQQLETRAGRDPTEKGLYLPRTLDLDILFLENSSGPVVVIEPDLRVPHPRLWERPFVLEPMRILGFVAQRPRRPESPE